MQLDIDKNDIDVIRNEQDGQVKPLLFNIVKYTVAALPIVIPFAGLMYFTQDVLISIIGTVVIDTLIIIGFGVYAIVSNAKLPRK